MSRYRLTDRAKADVHELWEYIGRIRGYPDAADRQVEALHRKFNLLATQPSMGQARDDLRPGLRVFAAGSYVILYYPQPDGVEVAGVVHGAQDVEAMFRAGQR
jgi:toxin ParE1/3/4